MKIVRENDPDCVSEMVSVWRSGGLVVYPTETVYGLGVDATEESAVEKLWRFKGERGDKPVLVAVDDVETAKSYVVLSELGMKVVQKYWPGAVSVVCLSKNVVAKKVQGNLETLGVRCPANEVLRRAIAEFGLPVTSTSANLSGEPTARSLEEFLTLIPREKREMVDLFVDGRVLADGKPSTIVDVMGNELKILRQGDIWVEI